MSSGLGWKDTLGEAIDILTPTDPLKVTEDQRKKIGRLINADQDIRGKIKLLRALALVRSWDDAWYNKLDKLLNHIDNDLRPKRNRFIHDMWAKPKGKLQQLSRAPKIKRPQAFAALELSLERQTPVKMGEVWALATSILKAQIKLIQLYMQFQATQKWVDEQVEKKVAEESAAHLLAILSTLPAKSSPNSLAPQAANPQRSSRSRLKRQRQSSQK